MEITNLPTWVVVCVGLANLIQIFSSAVMLVLGVVLILMTLRLWGEISALATDVRSMVGDVRSHLPSLLESTDDTLKNVKGISDDARSTTHNVSGAVDRIAHLVSAISTKVESPAIKMVGALSGLAAGLKVFGGRKAGKADAEPPKRRGLLGIFK